MGCSVSRVHKTWSRSLLFKDFPSCGVGFVYTILGSFSSRHSNLSGMVWTGTTQDWNKSPVHTHWTLCPRSWPRGFGELVVPVLTPKYFLPCYWIPTCSLPLSEYLFTLHQVAEPDVRLYVWDRHGPASLHYRNRAEITVSWRRKSYPAGIGWM